MNYYECLGISKEATTDEIKKAFRKKSLLLHPDKPNGDAEQFKKINEAYQTLSDPQKKNIYDIQQKGGIPRNGGMPHNFHPNMDEVMSMFFNNNFPDQSQTTNNTARFKVFYNGMPARRKPPVIIEKVTISLEQSYMGGVAPLEINRWIVNNNVKTMEKENIYVKFPRGIDNNEMILIKDKGHNLDGMNGDIKIVFNIKNETIFIRRGVDLIYNKNVSLKEALTGLEMNIEHINGKKYKVDTVNNYCIINNNSNTSLPKLGMVRDNHTGKLIINFTVDFPKTLSVEVREKLKEIL
jgi:DnaJ family protein B protein 4